MGQEVQERAANDITEAEDDTEDSTTNKGPSYENPIEKLRSLGKVN